ncbi:NAD-dependent succinate-semialdehyde dehydrogenase [Peribacillus sp. SCS-37]|uniref:NAD-dependent succinate-semialdehyde dehydrogenase n=1 Tax=Paraperibacillus esterisolvens TaxID=3115296 RepID=UPI003905C35B
MVDVLNPATGEVVGQVQEGGRREARAAVDAAHEAFKSWSKKTAGERSELLMKWHHLIREHTDEIAEIMTREQGKPLKEAAGEVTYANSFISWYAEEAKRVYGQIIPASHPNKRILVQKQPVGVIAAITPWNFPAAMITRKVGPALAAGCTAVVKPAEQTPLTAIRMAELAYEAGIPRDVLQIVTGEAAEIGDAWMEDTRVTKISFTGSTEVGRLLMKKAADTVKKLSLELGGHAPFIVMEDADLDQAVNGLIASKFRNAGQTCVCANRIYVQEGIAEEFSAKFAAAAAKLKVGNGLQEGVDIGPLIDSHAVEKVQKHIDDAIQKGGRVLTEVNAGGNAEGYFVNPVVIADATEEMLCMSEETFGPVAPITVFKTAEEAVERANDTIYGLAAYVFTRDLTLAIRMSEELQYGIVGLNDGLPSVAQAPFGGFKQSGLGREGGHFGIEEYLEIKYISMGLPN